MGLSAALARGAAASLPGWFSSVLPSPLPGLLSPFLLVSPGQQFPAAWLCPGLAAQVQSPVEMYGFCAQPRVTRLLFFWGSLVASPAVCNPHAENL